MEYSEKILALMSQQGITAYRAAKDTGISASQFTKWKQHPTSKITSENLTKMADYLGCTVDALVGRSVLRVKLLRPGAVLPRRATSGSAGLDLSAAVDGPVEVRPGKIAKVPTGVAIQLDPGYVCLVFGRSGLAAKHGVAPVNAVGVVDSDYRGELTVFLTCHRGEGYTVSPGERVAQMVILPVSMAEPVQVEVLDETERGEGGFGSTGRGGPAATPYPAPGGALPAAET